MADSNRNDFMTTFSGKRFYPFDPKRDMDAICIRDIAHALSMSCRFAGHTTRFYSVAEHSVHLARHILKIDKPASERGILLELALWALLHDASEAYISDIVRPVKRQLGQYRAVEANIMDAIAYKFRLTDMQPEYITRIDNRIVIDERAQALRPTEDVWHYGGETEPLGVTLEFWRPDTAEDRFRGMYYSIIEEQYR